MRRLWTLDDADDEGIVLAVRDQFGNICQADRLDSQIPTQLLDGEDGRTPMEWRKLMYCTGGDFIKSNKYLTLIMSPQDAKMIDFLSNHQYCWCKYEDSNGNKELREWFYIEQKYITNEFFVNPGTQNGIFSRLEEKGFISIDHKRTKQDKRRWLKLEWDTMTKMINEKLAAYQQAYKR